MNTAIRAIPSDRGERRISRTASRVVAKPRMSIMLLGVAVLLSALAVIYVTDLNRRLFIQLQETQAAYNQLYVEQGKLILEQSTWSTQARIQSIAQERLGLVVPATASIVMLKD